MTRRQKMIAGVVGGLIVAVTSVVVGTSLSGGSSPSTTVSAPAATAPAPKAPAPKAPATKLASPDVAADQFIKALDAVVPGRIQWATEPGGSNVYGAYDQRFGNPPNDLTAVNLQWFYVAATARTAILPGALQYYVVDTQTGTLGITVYENAPPDIVRAVPQAVIGLPGLTNLTQATVG